MIRGMNEMMTNRKEKLNINLIPDMFDVCMENYVTMEKLMKDQIEYLIHGCMNRKIKIK